MKGRSFHMIKRSYNYILSRGYRSVDPFVKMVMI